jgi:hypothetical protein
VAAPTEPRAGNCNQAHLHSVAPSSTPRTPGSSKAILRVSSPRSPFGRAVPLLATRSAATDEASPGPIWQRLTKCDSCTAVAITRCDAFSHPPRVKPAIHSFHQPKPADVWCCPPSACHGLQGQRRRQRREPPKDQSSQSQHHEPSE